MSSEKIYILIITLFAVGLIGVLLWTLLSRSNTSINIISNAVTPTYVPTPTTVPLENCRVTQHGNPLLLKTTSYSIGILGRYQGTVTKVVTGSTGKPSFITLSSAKGDQTHTFDVTEAIHHAHSQNGDDHNVSIISPGMILSIGFVCLHSENDQFRLSDIGFYEQ